MDGKRVTGVEDPADHRPPGSVWDPEVRNGAESIAAGPRPLREPLSGGAARSPIRGKDRLIFRLVMYLALVVLLSNLNAMIHEFLYPESRYLLVGETTALAIVVLLGALEVYLAWARRTEMEYRMILATAMDVFWITDQEGRFKDINDAACRHLGYTREELLGRMRIWDVEAVESPEEVAAHIRKVREVGHDQFESRHRRKDGTLVNTEVSVHYTDTGGGRYFTFIRDITERKRAEEALKRLHAGLEAKVRERTAELSASNERLRETQRQQRALLDAIPDIAWLKDREGRLIAVNRAYGQACGIDPADLIGKTDLDAWPRELAEKYMADDRAVVASRGMKRVEEPMLGRDGEKAWADTFKVPFFSEEGEVIGTAGIARNVTERHRAEEALKESEERFRRLFDQSPLGAAIASLDFRFLRVNETFSRITGYFPKELASLTFADLTHPEDLEADFAQARRLIAGEIEQYDMEKRYIRKDGGIVWVWLNVRGIRDADGRLLYCLPVVQDITERKRMEEALRRSHETLEERVRERTTALMQVNETLEETTRTLEELIQASPVGIYVLDPEGKVLLWNPAMEQILGWTQDEVQGRLPPTVAAGQEGSKETLERILAGEMLAAIEVRRTGKDGRPVDLRLWTAPIREETGGLRSTIAIVLDVTQLKEMERVALVQQKMASLGHVAAGIAHEIRNPLSGLNLYLHSLETFLGEAEISDPEVQERMDAVMASMKAASTKMESVIQRVLTFSQPGPPRMEPIDVNACIQDAVDMARIALQKAGARVAVALREDLPACLGDRQLLAQALINLLSNAAQAMEGQKQEMRIEVLSGVGDSHVTVSVADAGPGVPEELREKVFDPFFTTKGSGTGIGLSITQKIVSDHGGFIRVGTSRWGGALFTIGLPAGDQGNI